MGNRHQPDTHQARREITREVKDMAEGQTVRINPEKIPTFARDYLMEKLYKGMIDYFNVPENQQRFEAWKAAKGSEGQK